MDARERAPRAAAALRPDAGGTITVELFWLPLGAGERTGTVRYCGRVYEALSAWRGKRPRRSLFHSALRVVLDGSAVVVEMAPVWSRSESHRGVVCEGAVGRPWLGRSRLFRYEVRRWSDGVIPDAAYAVESPRRLDTDRARAERLLDAVPAFPTATWGLDEMGTGEMWNSNSLVSWLLAVSGHETAAIAPPSGGRAPGWSAGLAAALSSAAPECRPVPRRR